jgi:predicted branched-subunit amino acid permease
MAGAIAIVAVLVVFPSLVLISGGVAAALLGHVLQRDGEARHEGSELLSLDD